MSETMTTSYDTSAPFISKHLAPYTYTGVRKVTANATLYQITDPAGISAFRSLRELAALRPGFVSAVACAKTMVDLSESH